MDKYINRKFRVTGKTFQKHKTKDIIAIDIISAIKQYLDKYPEYTLKITCEYIGHVK